MGFLTIADAMRPENNGSFFDLCCVVTEIGLPHISRGTDYTCTFRVMDQTYTAYGIPTTFFAKFINHLPMVDLNSNIAIFKNLKITKKSDGENVFFSSDKKYSSFALFAQDVAPCSRPCQTSAKYRGGNHEIGLAEQIRQWLTTSPSLTGLRSLERQISDIKAGCSFDLVVQVLHTRKELNLDQWSLFVWDGTDAPPIEFDPTESAYALQVVPPAYVPAKPVGTSLLVTSRKEFREFNHLQGNICWVRLCNVFLTHQSGMWRGVLQCDSMIRLLSERDAGVVDRIRMYENRVSSHLSHDV